MFLYYVWYTIGHILRIGLIIYKYEIVEMIGFDLVSSDTPKSGGKKNGKVVV